MLTFEYEYAMSKADIIDSNEQDGLQSREPGTSKLLQDYFYILAKRGRRKEEGEKVHKL